MTFHILDLIMYFVLLVILWKSLPEDYKEELGAMVGFLIVLIYTILYIIFFGLFDFNWVNIFESIVNTFNGENPKVKW